MTNYSLLYFSILAVFSIVLKSSPVRNYILAPLMEAAVTLSSPLEDTWNAPKSPNLTISPSAKWLESNSVKSLSTVKASVQLTVVAQTFKTNLASRFRIGISFFLRWRSWVHFLNHAIFNKHNILVFNDYGLILLLNPLKDTHACAAEGIILPWRIYYLR